MNPVSDDFNLVTVEAYDLLGARVHGLTMDDLHHLLAHAIRNRVRAMFVSQNLHGIYVYHRHPAMRDLHSRAYVRVDGMPLVFWGRLLGYPLRHEHRVTWVDWMPVLMEDAAAAGWKVFYLGAPPGVAEAGVRALRLRHAGLQIQAHHGHFEQTSGSPANEAVIQAINESHADILLVGMGMPRQEQWLLANLGQLQAPVIMTCGAAIEYFAGTMLTPPRWMGRLGLEWLYRLACEPRRLTRRYLIEPWALLPLMGRDIVMRLRGRR